MLLQHAAEQGMIAHKTILKLPFLSWLQEILYSSLPTIVLGVQQEIRTDNSDAHGHNNQDEEYQKHETKHEVDLVRPEGREDEVPGIKKIRFSKNQ